MAKAPLRPARASSAGAAIAPTARPAMQAASCSPKMRPSVSVDTARGSRHRPAMSKTVMPIPLAASRSSAAALPPVVTTTSGAPAMAAPTTIHGTSRRAATIGTAAAAPTRAPMPEAARRGPVNDSLAPRPLTARSMRSTSSIPNSTYFAPTRSVRYTTPGWATILENVSGDSAMISPASVGSQSAPRWRSRSVSRSETAAATAPPANIAPGPDTASTTPARSGPSRLASASAVVAPAMATVSDSGSSARSGSRAKCTGRVSVMAHAVSDAST